MTRSRRRRPGLIRCFQAEAEVIAARGRTSTGHDKDIKSGATLQPQRSRHDEGASPKSVRKIVQINTGGFMGDPGSVLADLDH